MPKPNDMVSVAEAARIKGVPESTVRTRIARGRLPAVKSEHIWLIRRRDLEAWVVQRKEQP